MLEVSKPRVVRKCCSLIETRGYASDPELQKPVARFVQLKPAGSVLLRKLPPQDGIRVMRGAPDAALGRSSDGYLVGGLVELIVSLRAGKNGISLHVDAVHHADWRVGNLELEGRERHERRQIFGRAFVFLPGDLEGELP